MQGALDFGSSYRVEAWWSSVHALVREVVELVGLKEYAYHCDAKPSLVADALAGRNHKHVRIEWLLVLLDLAPPVHRERLLVALTAPLGYTLGRRAQLSPEDELTALRRTVQRLAPVVLELADKELGR